MKKLFILLTIGIMFQPINMLASTTSADGNGLTIVEGTINKIGFQLTVNEKDVVRVYKNQVVNVTDYIVKEKTKVKKNEYKNIEIVANNRSIDNFILDTSFIGKTIVSYKLNDLVKQINFEVIERTSEPIVDSSVNPDNLLSTGLNNFQFYLIFIVTGVMFILFSYRLKFSKTKNKS
ncbi:MAG: hypothetical protein ACRC5R_02465 [Mycoplasmatales bacterium]